MQRELGIHGSPGLEGQFQPCQALQRERGTGLVEKSTTGQAAVTTTSPDVAFRPESLKLLAVPDRRSRAGTTTRRTTATRLCVSWGPSVLVSRFRFPWSPAFLLFCRGFQLEMMLLRSPGRIDFGLDVADLLVEFPEPAFRTTAELNIPPALEVDIVLLEYECKDLLCLLADGACASCHVISLQEIGFGHRSGWFPVDGQIVTVGRKALSPSIRSDSGRRARMRA